MLGHDSPAIVIPQNTAYATEMRKWEATHTQFGSPGRPYQFREFPKRMYLFAHVPGKGIVQQDAQTVNDEHEERNLLSRGFHFGPQAAHDAAEREAHIVHGTLAAEREHAIQHGKHSERAVQEIRAAEAAHGAAHLPEVPETPIRRRGRKPKAEAS